MEGKRKYKEVRGINRGRANKGDDEVLGEEGGKERQRMSRVRERGGGFRGGEKSDHPF